MRSCEWENEKWEWVRIYKLVSEKAWISVWEVVSGMWEKITIEWEDEWQSEWVHEWEGMSEWMRGCESAGNWVKGSERVRGDEN